MPSETVSFSGSKARLGWILPVGVMTLALMVGSVHLTDEAYLALQGDPPRYLMNGVFFLDLAHNLANASSDPRGYAERYYARYPALSLGFHPVLPSLLVAPVFGLLGVSASSARVVPLTSFVVASVLLLWLVERIYDRYVATVATVLFILSPFAAQYSRVFQSEMPALTMVMAAALFCERYRESHRQLDMTFFIGFTILSLYGKQLAAVMLPVYALYLVSRGGGIQRFVNVKVIVGAAFAAALVVPLLAMTLALSGYNVRWVMQAATGHARFNYIAILHALVAQVSWPIVLLAAIGLVRSLWARDGRSTLFLLWVGAFVLLVVFVTKDVEVDRYTVYWVPAVCTVAATGAIGWRLAPIRTAALGLLVACASGEAMTASTVHPTGAGGYEDAARYVAQQAQGKAVVLFSGDLDTGYFVFFVRKHDPDRRLVVLRADKILTTSYMGDVAYKEQVAPEQVDGILSDFGTRFVVIEDRPSSSKVLEWLRSRVRRPPYVERLRVPIRSSDDRMKNTALAVFENVSVPAPNPGAILRLDLPVAGLVINVRLGEVLDGPGLRQ